MVASVDHLFAGPRSKMPNSPVQKSFRRQPRRSFKSSKDFKLHTIAKRVTPMVHSTFHVSNLKKCLSDEPLAISLDELRIDDKLRFVEEPVEIMDREIKRLRQSCIPIIKVKQKKDGIFISQYKYVAEILRKFVLTKGKSARTPIDTKKPLLKDPDGEDVDVHTYRLISWQCKKQIVVATLSIEAEYVAAASCCVQVLWIQNQLLDYGDSPLLGVNTPRSDEDRLELMELTIFLLPKVEKVGIRVNDVDLQVSAVRHKLLLFSLTNWRYSLSAVRSSTIYALTVRVLKLRRLQKVGTSQRIETSDDIMMDDESNQGRMIVEIDQDDAVVLKDDKEDDREVADVVKYVKEAKVVENVQEDEIKPTEVQEVVDVVTAAKLITEVVTAVSETVTAASAIITTAEAQVPAATTATLTVAHDKGKGILVEEPKPLKKKQQIKQDEQYARELHAELNKDMDWDKSIDHVKLKAKEDPAVKKYQAMKRKPQTEAQARKNMTMYLKNVVGFKMNYIKGMSYDDIHPIFEDKFNLNVAFLLKTKKEIEEDENRALQKLNETPAERAAKRRKLDEEVEEIKRHLQIVPNKDDDVYTEANHLPERFSTTKPKSFSDDFLLVTLGAMFEKPDIHAQIWKNQRTVHGLAKVKGWKLLESCGVQIITFTFTQLKLLVKRKYPLTRFTLDQMLDAVRLEVKEESEVSLELLRFTRQ
uniref:Copia protein n=1 Tax=Tanacetum cinerariifolium TaxID=118510 RepID=A0A6L2JGC9_TANCI|nr:copia protein [Tanacetum cinerariifolium]